MIMQLTPNLEARLCDLMRVFLKENENLNLSALRTEEQCWIGNILDSLSFLDVLKEFSILNSQFSILDVGTGGGFPLLPLAIALPEHRFTGIDATRKKIDAVYRIIRALTLNNVELIAERSEVLGQNQAHREKYDVVLSRAVAELPTLLEYCAPFACVNGYIVLWKSLSIEQELKNSLRATKEFHCDLVTQHRYTLPGDFLAGRSPAQRGEGWGERQLLVFKKTAALAKNYPREVGLAKKKPIT
jgi:16S rRNA (guanine527-N7)-methyltransferase